MIRQTLVSALFVALSAGAANAVPPPPTPGDVAVFKEDAAYVLRASQDSMPLYTFGRDQPGKSNCNGHCAVAWPPLPAATDDAPVGDWSVIKRDDGNLQWAWRRQPIYTFAKDSPQAATGDGLGGIWKLIPTIPAD